MIQRVVSPGFFAALGLRLTAGRSLARRTSKTSADVIVVNRLLRRSILGDRPVGRSCRNLGMCRGEHDRWEVVGVVDDMRQEAPPTAARRRCHPVPPERLRQRSADPIIVVRSGPAIRCRYAAALRSLGARAARGWCRRDHDEEIG